MCCLMASRFHLFGVVLARSFFPSFRLWNPKAVQMRALCRPRRELSNAYLLAKFRFDTAENEPCKARLPEGQLPEVYRRCPVCAGQAHPSSFFANESTSESSKWNNWCDKSFDLIHSASLQGVRASSRGPFCFEQTNEETQRF